MHVTDVETIRFTDGTHYTSDEKGHGHPGDPYEATKTLTRVVVEDGPGPGYEIGWDLTEADRVDE